MRIKRSWIYWGAGMIAIALLAYFFLGAESQPENVLDINLAEHKNLALHIHPKVTITINGENYPIPSNIGISSEGMRVIHTHESDGTLHVESPFPHQFYLEDFFTIWGKRFSDSCVMEYCEDGENSLTVYVNGEVSELKGLTPLYDRDEIGIVYGEREQ